MFDAKPRLARLLTPALLACACAAPALGQMKALRQSDDQFIRGLREQGMSDLLEHFVETDPPQEPVAQLALEIALKEFVADDRLARASQANQVGDVAQAVALFEESRLAFEEVAAAQKRLITDHRDDERLPLWQTDYAEMLLFRYLPRYHQNVNRVYEFGLPNDAQRAAYESAMVEAFVATMDASDRIDDLDRRLGQDAALKPKLEAMGIWFTIEDYRRLNTPYWLAQAAHGVSLLPADHPYFKAKRVRAQRVDDPAAEKKRLRDMVVNALAAGLMQDDRTKLTAKLFSGRTLVWSSDINDIDDGVDEYLEGVIAEAANGLPGYLATLSKAVGRWNAGGPDLATAIEILQGMGSHQYVEAQARGGDITPRLLAADLLFRILEAEAKKLPAADQPAKIAEAYEQAYVPLIGGDAGEPYRRTLFERWADSAGEVDDPSTLPAAVRMGIGEQLTQQGGALVNLITQTVSSPPPAIPADAQRWREQLEQQRQQAVAILDRAVLFNQTLIGEGMQGPLLARGLFNLGLNRYGQAELDRIFFREGNGDPVKYQDVAELWLQVGERVPEASQAKDALIYAMGLMSGQDQLWNKDTVTQPRVRKIYKGAFDLLNATWPQEPPVHDQRVYAGFYLYEKPGDFDQAVAVYRALPRDHREYFQARRQMIYVLQRQFRRLADGKLLLESTQPADDAPAEARDRWEVRQAQVLEDLERLRGDVVEEAELVILDAEEVVENGDDPKQQFDAATALGASTVVLAGVHVEAGETPQALELLDGFEDRYAADGPYAGLAAQQQDPESAKANLLGLVQSAQEQRILALIDAGQVDQMAEQARRMMDAQPDVAAAVVNGVLGRIRTTIERERRAEENAAFARQAEQARENIRTQARFAVKLGELLVQWAQAQGFGEQKMAAYQMPLAESLILAGDIDNAVKMMKPIAEAFPNNFDIRMKAGKAYIEVYRRNKSIDNYNAAHDQFKDIIVYYNARPNEKPDQYWDAWLQVITLKDIAGGDLAKDIPGHARLLRRVDENLGGPAFKDKFIELFDRNGGIERLTP